MYTLYYAKIQHNELIENDETPYIIRNERILERNIQTCCNMEYTQIFTHGLLTYNGKQVAHLFIKVDGTTVYFEITVRN